MPEWVLMEPVRQTTLLGILSPTDLAIPADQLVDTASKTLITAPFRFVYLNQTTEEEKRAVSEVRSDDDDGNDSESKARKRNPDNWRQNIRKKKKNLGLEYVKSNGEVSAKKEMGPPCSCRMKCFLRIGEEACKKVFNSFWQLGDYSLQNAYIAGCVRILLPKQYKKGDDGPSPSRRFFTRNFYVNVHGIDTEICKQAFLNLHSISNGRLDRLLKKKQERGNTGFDERPRYPNSVSRNQPSINKAPCQSEKENLVHDEEHIGCQVSNSVCKYQLLKGTTFVPCHNHNHLSHALKPADYIRKLALLWKLTKKAKVQSIQAYTRKYGQFGLPGTMTNTAVEDPPRELLEALCSLEETKVKGRHNNKVNKVPEEKVREVRRCIDGFRKSAGFTGKRKARSAEILPAHLNIRSMYRKYRDEMMRKGSVPVCEFRFRKIFHSDFRIEFARPAVGQTTNGNVSKPTVSEERSSPPEDKPTYTTLETKSTAAGQDNYVAFTQDIYSPYPVHQQTWLFSAQP